jgi:TRAP-type C4-dicarboxylate transport system permease small subunit
MARDDHGAGSERAGSAGSALESLFAIDLEWKRWWAIIPELLAAGCTAALPIMITMNVISRYTDWYRIPWVNDIVGVLFVWMVFLGGALAVKYGAHVRLGFISDRLVGKKWGGRAWGHVIRVAPIGLGLILLVLGVRIVGLHMKRELTWLQIPSGYFSTVIPISGALMIVYAMRDFLHANRGKKTRSSV